MSRLACALGTGKEPILQRRAAPVAPLPCMLALGPGTFHYYCSRRKSHPPTPPPTPPPPSPTPPPTTTMTKTTCSCFESGRGFGKVRSVPRTLRQRKRRVKPGLNCAAHAKLVSWPYTMQTGHSKPQALNCAPHPRGPPETD